MLTRLLGGLLALHEDLDDLGAGELRGRVLALREHLAYLGAGDENVVLLVVGAGLGGAHALADEAEEGVLEEEGGEPYFAFLEFVEDVLGVVVAVEGVTLRVLAGARVVAADDKVGAAVVLAADRVEDRLARAAVAHRRREDAEEGAVLRVVLVEDDLVGAHPYVRRDVLGAGLADQRVEEEAVDYLERALLDVLVGAVDGVARLEADDALPALLGKDLAQLARGVVVLGERLRVRVVDEEGDLAPDQGVLLAVDGGDAGVLFVRRAEDLAGLALPVVGELVLDEHGGEDAAIAVHERDLVALGDGTGLGVVHGEGDREAPDQPVLEVHRLDDRIVVGLDHEAGQRREDARGDHLEVGEGPGLERYPAQALGPLE